MAKKVKGVGDLISNITEAIGIEECKGCENKKHWLNINFPFHKPTPLTLGQKERIETEPLKVYNEAFGTDIDNEHFKGGVKASIIKKLTKLSNYEN
jgi:hypothetical protein